MPGATWDFKMDLGRDATYGGALDDLSGYVLNANWNEGFDKPYASIAPAAKLNVTLRNDDGRFTNERLGNELIVNGGFDSWTSDDPNGWTITGQTGSNQIRETDVNGSISGTGYCSLVDLSSSHTTSIQQDMLTIGTVYRVSINVYLVSIDLLTVSTIALYNGSTLIGQPLWEAGSYTFYFVATAASLIIKNWQAHATTVTFDNVSCKQVLGGFQPLLRLGTLGRLRATYNGSTETMFVGRLTKKTPAVGRTGQRTISLEFTDPTDDMAVGDYKPELQEDVTTDVAIDPVFDDAKIAFPYSHSYWMLGIPGCSELGVETYLFSPAATSFETGYTTLEFVGDVSDTTGTGIQPLLFIQQMMDAEMGGRFWFDPRTSTFTMHSRNHDTLNRTIAATLTDADFEASMSTMVDGDDLENQTTVNCQPRKVGAENTVIWTAQNLPIQIVQGQEYKTTASFIDIANGNSRMSAKDVALPIWGTDLIVAMNDDGSGAISNRKVPVSAKMNANTAEFVITNLAVGSTAYITTFQLRGTPITFYDPKSMTSLNGDSIRDNVLAQNQISIPALSSEDDAQAYADYRVAKFGTPSQHFATIGFYANGNDERMTNAISLTVGDRITVQDSFSGHDADYVIVGANHQMNKGGDNQHSVTWIVKPQSREIFWLLGIAGYSELGITTRPAF